MSDLISLREYAQKHYRNIDTVRQKVLRGGFKTARKIGRNWVICSAEPYIDLRRKHKKESKNADRIKESPEN